MRPGDNFLLDSLHNAHPDTARSESDKTYARGVIVGLVSGLMAKHVSNPNPYRRAIEELAYILNINGTCRPVLAVCVPECWLEDFQAAKIRLE